jgi:hypothetical protein
MALPAAGQERPRQLSPAQAQEDFDVLHRALEEAHGGFDRFVAKPELARHFAAHRARIVRPVSRLEFAGILSEAIAILRDGHARLEFDSATTASLAAARLFPLRIALEDTRPVVRLNDSPLDRTIVPGAEIISVNGRAAAEIIDALLTKVSPDGFIETGKRHRLALDFARLYWLYIEQPDTFAIVARAADGRLVRTTVAGVLDRDRRTTTNPVNETVSANTARLDGPPGLVALSFPLDSGVARLRVRAFDGQSFPATLDSVFDVLKTRGTTALILDLRGNGGGVDEYGARLVSYFVNEPFRYFDRIHIQTIAPSFATWPARTFDAVKAGSVPDPTGGFLITEARHSGVGLQQPAANGFRGRLIVLIDGGSFSTTADVAAQLRSRGRAVFVGEETAGTYEGNTSGLNARIDLPHSGFRLRVMMYGYWNAVTPVPGGRGIIPDHVATRRVADLIAGRDPALDLAHSLAKNP